MRKVIFFSFALILLPLALQGPAFAEQETVAQVPSGQQPAQPPQVAPMQPMMPGMMGPGMMGQWQGSRSWRAPGFFLRLREQLNLTEDQVRNLSSIRFSYLKETETRGAAVRVAELELRELTSGGKWDVAQAEAKIKEIGNLRTEWRVARLKALDNAREVLSEEQRKKVQELTEFRRWR